MEDSITLFDRTPYLKDYWWWWPVNKTSYFKFKQAVLQSRKVAFIKCISFENISWNKHKKIKFHNVVRFSKHCGPNEIHSLLRMDFWKDSGNLQLVKTTTQLLVPSRRHLGVNKTLNKMRERFYWVKMRKDVETWCNKCLICSTNKGPPKRTRRKMGQYTLGAPF